LQVVREWGGEARSWIFELNGWIDDGNRSGCELSEARTYTSILYKIAVHTGEPRGAARWLCAARVQRHT
jgi:hypothetical protein